MGGGEKDEELGTGCSKADRDRRPPTGFGVDRFNKSVAALARLLRIEHLNCI